MEILLLFTHIVCAISWLSSCSKIRERTAGAYMCIDVHPTGTQRGSGHESDYLSNYVREYTITMVYHNLSIFKNKMKIVQITNL